MSAPVFFPAVVPVPPYISGRWYPTSALVNAGGAAAAVDTVRLYPFILRQPVTVSDLGTRITTVGGGSFQLAIYGNNPATMRPTGAVLARTAGMLNTSLAVVSADITGANVALSAGVVYWGATNVDASSAAAVFQTPGQSAAGVTDLVGALTLATATGAVSGTMLTLTTPMAYDTWSDITGATFTEVSGAAGASHIFIKAA